MSNKLETVKEMIKLGELSPVDGIVEYEGIKYKVSGTKRLSIKEYKERVKKEKPVFDENRICEDCGEAFKVSKFNPYFAKCPNCRGKKKHVKEDFVKNCTQCGKEFKVSKFNPYYDICPDCRKPKKIKKVKETAKEMKLD